MRGPISGFGARIAIFTISRVKNFSTAGPCTNLRFRAETKGNLSHKWLGQLPCLSRIILKVLSASQDRNELPGANRGASWPVLAQGQPRWPFYQGWDGAVLGLVRHSVPCGSAMGKIPALPVLKRLRHPWVCAAVSGCGASSPPPLNSRVPCLPGVQYQCQWPFYKGRWPFYHANVQEDGAVSQMAARFKPRIANSI